MKIQGLAKITQVWLPAYVEDSNDEHNRCDIQIDFRYNADVDGNDKTDASALGLTDELVELCEAQVSQTDYHYLWDASRNGYEDAEKACTELEGKLLNKELYFTTYKFSIAELLKNTRYEGVSVVNNGERNYTSFNSSYLLKYDDEQSVFDSMQANLVNTLNEGTYEQGRVGAVVQKEEEPKQGGARRVGRR